MTTTLYFKDGKSDKQYTATLDGGTVTFAWGRRGSTLQTDTKQLTPEAARKLFDSKIAEKISKGYTPGDDAPAIAVQTRADRVTELPKPMLLNPITMAEVEKLLDDDEWLMQEKADGVRAIVRLNHASGSAQSASRADLPVALTDEIVRDLLKIFICDATLDCEVCGDRIVLLDILEHNGTDITNWTCDMRVRLLKGVIDDRVKMFASQKTVFLIGSFASDKRVAMRLLHEAGAEGVVFKRRNSTYKPGRPNSGGDGLKFKFTATASVIVTGSHAAGKRSLMIAAKDGVKLHQLGSVNFPEKHGPFLKAGTIIEVEYLYAHRGGSLSQPVFKCVREDKRVPDDVKTLQYKGEAR